MSYRYELNVFDLKGRLVNDHAADRLSIVRAWARGDHRYKPAYYYVIESKVSGRILGWFVPPKTSKLANSAGQC